MENILKILIIDDEPLARAYLSSILRESEMAFEIFESCDAIEAMDKIEEISPNIVYLDIEMPEMSGIDLVRQLEPLNFVVVFQTAYAEYAVNAFELNACDYILKPYEKERVFASLTKALEKVKYNKIKQNENIHSTMNQFKPIKNFIVTQYSTKIIVSVSEIERFRSDNHQTLLIWNDREDVCHFSLEKLEKQLSPDIFFRIHRDNIIRIKDVFKILRDGHNYNVKLKNDIVLPLARTRKAKLISLLAGT